MKRITSTKILTVVMIFGLSLLLYPTVSDWWNTFHQSQMVNQYIEQLDTIDEDKYKELIQAAEDYNKKLLFQENPFVGISEEETETHNRLLNITGDGIIGTINIPAINCTLPIYHGTSDDVLSIAVGHVEGSSLPIGGESTHAALSGHRGLPSAKIFTDLNKLVAGDTFNVQVLGKTLTYEVSQILIVEPQVLTDLAIVPGKDLCTLITCTPLGVNTHRILVQGHRIETEYISTARVVADGSFVDPIFVAPILFIPLLCLWIIITCIPWRKLKERWLLKCEK